MTMYYPWNRVLFIFLHQNTTFNENNSLQQHVQANLVGVNWMPRWGVEKKIPRIVEILFVFFCFGKQHNINFAHPWNMLFVLSVFANTPQKNITLMLRILDTYYLYFLVPQFSKVKPAVFFGYLKQQNKTLNRFADPWDCCLYFLFSRES